MAFFGFEILSKIRLNKFPSIIYFTLNSKVKIWMILKKLTCYHLALMDVYRATKKYSVQSWVLPIEEDVQLNVTQSLMNNVEMQVIVSSKDLFGWA